MNQPEIKLGQVWQEKGSYKRVITERNIGIVTANIKDYEYICDRPHQDGSYNYFCNSEWCRCQQ